MAIVASSSPVPGLSQAPVNQGPCQLYIKVLEARNLKGLDKNGVSDPIVELYIGPVRKSPLSTKVYNKTVNPQWHEEFIFTLPEQNVPITLHVWDYVRIFSNVTLGTATLDPSTIAPNTAVDIWLPVTGLNGQGEVHIFAQSTPLTARNPAKGTRLSTFRMILERKVYFPNEVVRGAMVFNVGMPLKIRGVRVKFEGYTKTSWSETRGTDKNRRTVWYHSHVVYFNPTATLYGNPRGVRGDMIIPSGGYFWPFEFVLPANCAPSYTHTYGSNSYFIKGYVDIPMGFDRTVTEPLTMTVQYGTLQPVLFTKTSGKAKAIFAADQNITVSATAGPVAYMGEGFDVTLTIVNQGTKAVREVLVSLHMKAFFTATSIEGRDTRKVRAEIMSHKVAGVAGFPIPPGQTWSGKIRIQIPTKIAPSIPANCSPLIQIYHTIKTRVNTEGNFFTKASNEKKFPVLVGETYPFLPQVIAAPPPTQQSGVIVVAQPPPDVYRYLAPGAMVGEEYNPVGRVVPHDVFAAQGVVQCEQYVETVPDSVNFDPSQLYGPTGYAPAGSPPPQGSMAQQGYAAPQGMYPQQQQQQQQVAPGYAAQQGYQPQQYAPQPQGYQQAPQPQYTAQPQGSQQTPQPQYAAPQGTYSPQPTHAQQPYGQSSGPAQGYPAPQGPYAQQGMPSNNPYAQQGVPSANPYAQQEQGVAAQQGYLPPQQAPSPGPTPQNM
jgi:hypothetical protein